MSKSKKLKALAVLAADVMRLCYRVGANRWLDELELFAESQERQHRATGRRVYGAVFARRPTYAGSVRDAVNYFICKTVLEAMPVPSTWAQFASIRRDHQLGQACREAALGATDEVPALEARWTELAIDYSEHIAGAK